MKKAMRQMISMRVSGFVAIVEYAETLHIRKWKKLQQFVFFPGLWRK